MAPADLTKGWVSSSTCSLYPTAYWKSPFFVFLQTDADTALRALLQLVGFCTERLIAEYTKHSSAPPSINLVLSDGTAYEFKGGGRAFLWFETSVTHAGQLHSALAALERYLTLRIDAGHDIDPELERILLSGNSAGLLGVLTDVGKFKPELFRGVLRPFVTQSRIYNWDDERIKALQFFPAPHWARQGDLIFNMARDWHNAPYRHRSLREVPQRICVSCSSISAVSANTTLSKRRISGMSGLSSTMRYRRSHQTQGCRAIIHFLLSTTRRSERYIAQPAPTNRK